MRRRRLLATLAGTSITGVAGCIGGVFGNQGQSSCSVPSTDNLQSLFPSDSDRFSGQFGTSGGLGDIGAEDYFVGRYEGPNGGTHDMVVAEYPSQTEAEENREAVLSKAEFPATGYLVVGQYLVVVDGQSRETARGLVAESDLGDGCASELTFVSDSPSGGVSETTEPGDPDSASIGLPESFERDELLYAGSDDTAATISDARAYRGSRALRWISGPPRNGGTIDTREYVLEPPVAVEWYVYKEGPKDAGFVFGVQDAPSGYNTGDKYLVDSRSSGGRQAENQLYFYRYEGGTETVLASTETGATPPEEQWNRYVLEWETDGTMTYTAYDGTGSTVAARLRVTDTTFSRGGIGWRSDDPDNYAYYDYLRVV